MCVGLAVAERTGPLHGHLSSIQGFVVAIFQGSGTRQDVLNPIETSRRVVGSFRLEKLNLSVLIEVYFPRKPQFCGDILDFLVKLNFDPSVLMNQDIRSSFPCAVSTMCSRAKWLWSHF